MSEKAVFVCGALISVHLPGNLALPLKQRLPLAENESAYTVYAAPNIASLLDYGINKCNCITVSLQFML